MASYCQVLLLLLLMVSTEAVQLRPRKRPRTGSLTVTTTPSPSIAHLPNPRRNVLSVFSLPVGQGSAHVIQCPLSPSSNRADLTIFDMGSVSGNRHWKAADVYQYLQNRYSDIKNVIITHENADHYNLLQDAIWSQLGAGQNVNVYVSCSRLGMHDGSTQANLTKNTFNNGDPCGLGTTNANCDASPSPFRLCPDINLNLFQGTILFANGQCSRNQRHNFNSITLRITSTPGQGQASILLSGDQMSDVLAPNLPPTTAYVLTHHGAEYGASDVFANSLRPSVVFASGRLPAVVATSNSAVASSNSVVTSQQ